MFNVVYGGHAPRSGSEIERDSKTKSETEHENQSGKWGESVNPPAAGLEWSSMSAGPKEGRAAKAPTCTFRTMPKHGRHTAHTVPAAAVGSFSFSLAIVPFKKPIPSNLAIAEAKGRGSVAMRGAVGGWLCSTPPISVYQSGSSAAEVLALAPHRV
ncbi:hypothetical protein SCP_0505330 [Sparassis crispa]|uniref:Uncharacterized protein n=1 Tax=Sparassis crispa TaxID=139825 RepID=A0A401GP04_9APHY|nr:hypothetical protein SCP_0505330 [Sparassis crispa]GBE83484.1 hypothetical protein SCP_0505330 [Sparassis crispa]